MKVVANATPLIALSLVGRLDLLRSVFQEVFVPSAVYDEVTAQGADRAGSAALRAAHWIRVQTPLAVPTVEPLLLGLDHGELQVLILAREQGVEWVLIDERLGRRIAQILGLRVTGTLGVLLAAARGGLVTNAEALDAARQMVSNGIRIHPRLLDWLAEKLGRS